jgi:hypothetical protein
MIDEDHPLYQQAIRNHKYGLHWSRKFDKFFDLSIAFLIIVFIVVMLAEIVSMI